MAVLLGGIGLIVFGMLCVMLTPVVLYLKREKRWEEAGRTIEAWYNPKQ